ncbi:hypothetical protein EJB05_10246, partial [Eragrostis curvula]
TSLFRPSPSFGWAAPRLLSVFVSASVRRAVSFPRSFSPPTFPFSDLLLDWLRLGADPFSRGPTSFNMIRFIGWYSIALRKMRKAKRGGGDLPGNSRKKRKDCNTQWVSGCLCDGDSSQDACPKLSDWGKSVVSISLCNGDITLFSCSGMAVAHEGYHRTRFLTSASLVRAFDGKTTERYPALKLKSMPHGKAYVVGRDVSGDLVAKSVELCGDLKVYKDGKDLDSKTSEAWEGATIFSFDGEVVGMNLFLVTEISVFLPWATILKNLERKWASWEKKTGHARRKGLVYGFEAPVNSHPEVLNQEHLDIDSMGYPKLPSTMLDAGMILVNTFEEPFGDIRGKGVWSKLGEKAYSRINRSVVALASFSGEKRNFACTGLFIGWNGSTKILTSASLIRNSGDESSIVENLRIEVLLPSNRRINGTLEHYDLHYNVALVSVKNRYDLRPANTLLSWFRGFDVAAVGRCFKSGALMATSGELIFSTGTLDCDFLRYSSCKITKVGIGGPLVTLDGDVLGMNFYDKKIGTPYLSWPHIAKILASFEKSEMGEICNDTLGAPLWKMDGGRRNMLKSEMGEICNDTSGAPLWKTDRDRKSMLNRWPVPMPCWRHPDYVDEDKVDDDDGVEYIKGGNQIDDIHRICCDGHDC